MKTPVYPRSKYVRIYVPVSQWGKRCLIHKDNRVACFTDYEQANSEATKVSNEGFIVVSLDWFMRNTLSQLITKPAALLIYTGTGKCYHAELNATAEDLRTLNQIQPSDFDVTPSEVKKLISNRRVWEATL